MPIVCGDCHWSGGNECSSDVTGLCDSCSDKLQVSVNIMTYKYFTLYEKYNLLKDEYNELLVKYEQLLASVSVDKLQN